MNPIESGALSTAGFDSSVATANSAAVGATTTLTTNGDAAVSTSSTTASLSTTADSVSPELQVSKQISQTSALVTSNDQFFLLNKVIDTLTSVVTAVVGLVTTLVGQMKGSAINAANCPGTTSSATARASESTGSNSSSNRTTGQASVTGTNQASTVVRSALDVNRNDAGMITVRTLDGFTIRAEGRDQSWSITGPDGRATRIWGDPHVSESDGDKWDFLNRSTFMFGKNKATVEVVPAGNGETLSARLTIYSDYERVTIDGIDKNQPTVVASSSDGLQHDAALADGEIYKRAMTANGEVWISAATGRAVG